jgi:ribosomal protein S18 acetylase RimI-like enzyme
MIFLGERFSIRPIQNDELDVVLGVYRQCEDFLALTPQPKASMSMVEADLEISRQSGGAFCGIYAPDGNMIGVLDVVISGFDGNPHHAFIELLMIGQPYRGKGLGTAIVKALEGEIARDARVTHILSGVMVNNPAAVRFWQTNGYGIVGDSELMADGTTVWHLQKDLRRSNKS